MLKQDYILRMIEQMAQAFGRLLTRARTEQPEEVRHDLDQALKQLTGLSFDVLDSLPISAILNVFGAHTEADPIRLLAVAECSLVRAELAEAAENPNVALKSRVLALTMYLEAFAHFRGDVTKVFEARMERLVEDLHDYDLPVEAGIRLFRHRAADQHLAEAEDILFDLLEQRSEDAELVEEGRSFYHRLLGLTDGELEEGNLPRDEVLEGLAELDDKL